MSNDAVLHTPFPWTRHDDGGTLPGVYVKRGGFRYGPQASDWIWGPRGPGYGVVADCSPHAPATQETVANAGIIAAVPDLIAALEACVAEFRSLAATNGKAGIPEVCAEAIAALDLAFGRASGPASAEDRAVHAREWPVFAEAAR
jgi:hypothetical protein